jgi:hypothetical protein
VVHLNPTNPKDSSQEFPLGTWGRAAVAYNARQGSKPRKKQISEKLLKAYAEMELQCPQAQSSNHPARPLDAGGNAYQVLTIDS